MKSEEVARYLQDHPEFFDQYADLLAMVSLADPHSGRAISITEKQLINLRDKVRNLEAKLIELIRFGEENDSISEKVHGLAVAFNAASDQAQVIRALYSHLGGTFGVPHVGLRLWGLGEGSGHEFDAVDDAVKAFAADLQQPRCGAASGQESLAWFGAAAAHVQSMAQVPLRDPDGPSFGLLVLASDDPQRFHAELGTLYLERLGEMLAAALRRVAG